MIGDQAEKFEERETMRYFMVLQYFLEPKWTKIETRSSTCISHEYNSRIMNAVNSLTLRLL